MKYERSGYSKDFMPQAWVQLRRWSVVMSALAVLLIVCPAFGERPRTAVLVSEALQDKPYGELLGIELNRRGVSLVERTELDKIADEQQRSAFGGDAADSRIRIGQLVGAQCLALLDRPAAGGGHTEAVRLQVIDVATGLRLGSEVVLADSPQAAEASGRLLADAVLDVWERFPDGVASVVAVTPWLSENLTREYDALQTALAQLLVTSLQRQEGLAVVEIAEARRIERERNLGGINAASRPAPWVVEGRFELQPMDPGEPRKLDLSARLRRMGSDDEPQVWRQNNVPVEQVGSVVNTAAAAAVQHALSVDSRDRTTDNSSSVFDAMVARADRFSTVGMWGEAASLREAAIVADPHHDQTVAQRLAAAWDYARLLSGGLMRGLPEPVDDQDLELWTAAVRQRLDLWQRAMWHAEYLIMNRRIDSAAAHQIAKTLLGIPRRGRNIRDGSAQVLIAADEDRRRFLLDVLPRALDLPAPTDGGGQTSSDSRFASLALDSAVEPYYGRLTATDLNLFATLLISKLPADLPPDGQFVRYRLHGPVDRLPSEHYHGYDGVQIEPPVTAEQWEATMRRLASQSKEQRPAAWLVGQYALLAMGRWQADSGGGARRQTLYERARELEAAWQDLAGRDARNDALASSIEELRRRLEPRTRSTSGRRPAPPPRVERPEAIIGEGLEPVHLRIRREDGTHADAGSSWFDVLPVEGRPQGLLNIWVGRNAVFYERQLGNLELELTLQTYHRVTAARWDGRYAWIANPYEGVYLLDAAGDLVATFGKEAGLPAGTWTILVQPLGDGRAIAAGTNRPDQRSWIAELWLDEQGRPRVKLIHAAIKQSGWEDRDEQRADPEATGRYAWLWLWDRGKAGRYLIVGREHASLPLAVDLANGNVTTIGQPPLSRGVVNPFWGWDQRWYSFHAVTDAGGGPTNLLLSAGTYGVALYEVGDQPVGPNLTFQRIDQWSSRDSLDMGNVADGRLIPQPDGTMMFAGSGGGGWGRIHVSLDGAEPRVIGEAISPARLHDFFRSSAAPATGHGIVIWGLAGHQEAKVLRVRLADSTWDWRRREAR
ncbi:MAG: hypothetical protein WDZ31_04935 [Phycisphaeraceae bacterium]